MKKTLDELADEYTQAVERHDYLIKKYRRKLDDALEKHASQDEIVQLKTMISEFYREKSDMVQIIYRLRNYYKFSSRKESCY